MRRRGIPVATTNSPDVSPRRAGASRWAARSAAIRSSAEKVGIGGPLAERAADGRLVGRIRIVVPGDAAIGADGQDVPAEIEQRLDSVVFHACDRVGRAELPAAGQEHPAAVELAFGG